MSTLWVPGEILVHIASFSHGEEICTLALLGMVCKDWQALLVPKRTRIVDWAVYRFIDGREKEINVLYTLIRKADRADLLERVYKKSGILLPCQSTFFRADAWCCLQWIDKQRCCCRPWAGNLLKDIMTDERAGIPRGRRGGAFLRV